MRADQIVAPVVPVEPARIRLVHGGSLRPTDCVVRGVLHECVDELVAVVPTAQEPATLERRQPPRELAHLGDRRERTDLVSGERAPDDCSALEQTPLARLEHVDAAREKGFHSWR